MLAGVVQANHLRRAYYCGRSLFSVAKLVRKGHTVKDGSRLSKQWGEWMSGNAMERGALGGERDVELRGPAVSWTSSTELTHLPTSKRGTMLILKGVCSLFISLYTANAPSFSRGMCSHAFGHAISKVCVF